MGHRTTGKKAQLQHRLLTALELDVPEELDEHGDADMQAAAEPAQGKHYAEWDRAELPQDPPDFISEAF
jgi:hypothetical protein